MHIFIACVLVTFTRSKLVLTSENEREREREREACKELFALRVNARAIIGFPIIQANIQIHPPALRTAIRG